MSDSTARKQAATEIVIDRRVFLGSGAAVCAVSLLPLPAYAMPSPADPAPVTPNLLTDWTIDDMWGVYPRYADPIGYGRLRSETRVAAAPVDAAFVA
jgi:hypothetical protein